MKIKRIINLCKSRGMLTLFDDKEKKIQWISDGVALFPLYEMPKFDIDSICKAYEISESTAKKMAFDAGLELPSKIDYSDNSELDEITEPLPIKIRYKAMELTPLRTQYGISFINNDYLLAFTDYGNELVIAERETDGFSYFVIKNGLMLVGIVPPVDIINKDFLSDIRELYALVEAALYIKTEQR